MIFKEIQRAHKFYSGTPWGPKGYSKGPNMAPIAIEGVGRVLKCLNQEGPGCASGGLEGLASNDSQRTPKLRIC